MIYINLWLDNSFLNTISSNMQTLQYEIGLGYIHVLRAAGIN